MYRSIHVAVLLSVGVFGTQLLSAQRAPQPTPVRMNVSCSQSVQADFNAALTLLHHMTYPQAREGFVHVAERDPNCAMAYWGVAMTLFTPLWPTRPGPGERAQGWEMVHKAQSFQVPERERLFIAAAAAFFSEPAGEDYWARIRRWEAASQRAYAAMPNDVEAAAFYALAQLAVAQVAESTAANHARAATVLATILKQSPRHPGGMHYLIHANDLNARERESLEVTDAYMRVAPDNPHALHMPTHIYVRLGNWPLVVDGNSKAAEAALRHPAGPRGEYVWDEFPHAIEYLVYGLLQRGADDEARIQLTRLQQTARLEPTFKTAFHLASTAARYALERRDWSEAANLPLREPVSLAWDRFPWAEGVTVFARGYGAIKLGDSLAARSAVRRIGELEAAARRSGETLFERNLQVLRMALSARLEHAAGDRDAAESLMRQAAELEERTPKHAVTPGPTIPARELLGDLLNEQARPREALVEYERTLAAYPLRFNALLGAAQAAAQVGDSARATSYRKQLRQSADPRARRMPTQ